MSDEKFDLTGWEFVSNFGFTSKVYGRGAERVMIDVPSGKKVISWRSS